MSRYIDADATLETLKEILIKTAINNVGYKRDVDEVCKDIADNRLSVWLEYVPTADVREVVHGEWIPEPNCYYRCSNCKGHMVSIQNKINYSYCPYCGADMRGGRNERE